MMPDTAVKAPRRVPLQTDYTPNLRCVRCGDALYQLTGRALGLLSCGTPNRSNNEE